MRMRPGAPASRQANPVSDDLRKNVLPSHSPIARFGHQPTSFIAVLHWYGANQGFLPSLRYAWRWPRPKALARLTGLEGAEVELAGLEIAPISAVFLSPAFR